MSKKLNLADTLGTITTKSEERSTKRVNLIAEETPKPAPEKPREKPIRLSVDLAPDMHHWIKKTGVELAQEMNATRVTGADMARALLELAIKEPGVMELLKKQLYTIVPIK